jgi:hypothetical protein
VDSAVFVYWATSRRVERPEAMRTRRETVEHPFGTIKTRMGTTHFLVKRLHNVKTEMPLAVLGYNLPRVMNIISVGPLITAMREFSSLVSAQYALSALQIAFRLSLMPFRLEIGQTPCVP